MATLFIGNLDGRVERKHLYELGIQAGPVTSVSLPTGPDGKGNSRPYGFIEFEDEESCNYALRLLEGQVTLFNRKVSVAVSTRGRASTGGTPGDNAAQAVAAAATATATPGSSSHPGHRPPLPSEPPLPLPAMSAPASVPPVTPPELQAFLQYHLGGGATVQQTFIAQQQAAQQALMQQQAQQQAYMHYAAAAAQQQQQFNQQTAYPHHPQPPQTYFPGPQHW